MLRLSKISHVYPTLRLLRLANNNISDVGVTALAQQLQHLTALSELDLSTNYIGYDGAMALSLCISNSPSLTKLELQKNVLGDDGGQVIASKLHLCKRLTCLDLSDNGLADGAMRSLSESLHSCSLLVQLNLSSSEFWDEGITALARAFPNCDHLTGLDLSVNILGQNAFEMFAAYLTCLSSLKLLNLFGTGIDSMGATQLSRALPQCSNLETLELPWNDVGPAGCEYLAPSIPHSITRLNLSECNLGDDGVAHLAHWLTKVRFQDIILVLHASSCLIELSILLRITQAPAPACAERQGAHIS